MKTILRSLFAFLVLAGTAMWAEDAPPAAGTAPQDEASSPQAILATQVNEIASMSGLSRKEKEKRIADAVRLAITAATAGVSDPAQVLAIATSLATAAARGAPQFAQAIVASVGNIAVVTQIDGAFEQIRAAVLTAATSTDESGASVHFASNPPRPPLNPEFGGGTTDVVVSGSH